MVVDTSSLRVIFSIEPVRDETVEYLLGGIREKDE